LQRLSLKNNPLLFIDDNVLERFSRVPEIAQYKAEREYPANTTLARVYKNVLQVQNFTKELKQVFANLSQEEKNLIYKHVYLCAGSPQTDDLQWGEHQVFENFDVFGRAVRAAGLEKFNSLTMDEKNIVYGRIYDLAGKPQTTDPQWGENNAMNNLSRLFDAIA